MEQLHELELKDLAPALLRQERARSNVDPALLTPLLRGSAQLTAQRKRMEALVAAHPVLSRRDFVFQNHTERYNAAVAKTFHYVQLLRTHAIDDPEQQQLLYNAIGERLPIDVHLAMFIPTLANQADEQQQRRWLPLARSFRVIGAYAQTELGHGSNVQGIETTARYDVATQEFVIHSPTLTSRKWWPGGLGKTATHAIVHARLTLRDGSDAGIQAFIVPLRSRTDHVPRRGVDVGDIGPKVGFQSVDNGFGAFDSVRIPRDHMLMRFAHVAPDGTFTRPPSDKLVYLTMVRVRATLVAKLARMLGAAATIATRYSVAQIQLSDSRRMSDSRSACDSRNSQQPGQVQVQVLQVLQVLDSPSQQLAVLPYVALSVGAAFAGRAVNALHDRALATLRTRSSAFAGELAHVHAVASGLKAWLADEVGIGIEALRRRCGRHGDAQSSGLPHLYAEIVGASTYEGTFDVLVQQHARLLVKNAGNTVSSSVPKSRTCCMARTAADFGDVALLLDAFDARAIRATQRLVCAMGAQQSDADASTASGAPMVLMTKASVAHSELALLQAFAEGVASVPDDTDGRSSTRAAVADLCALLGNWLLVRSLGDFRDDDYVSSAQGELARTQLLQLLAAVRAHAVQLTDAWDFSDCELGSAIGRFDGDMYRALVARAADEPLNRTAVAASYAPFLQPLLESRL